jgi:signal transduction histidine kinase
LQNNSSAALKDNCNDSNSLDADSNYADGGLIGKSNAQRQARYSHAYRSLVNDYNMLATTIENLEVSVHELKRMNIEQNDFVSIAAHELKAPLMPILGIAELLELELEESGREEVSIKRDQIEGIIRNARRLAKFASEILDVTKIEGQLLILRKKDFDLNELIHETVNDYRKMLIKKNVKVRYQQDSIDSSSLAPDRDERAESKMFIFADRVRITQVISNLLDNAIRYTNPRGIIIILTAKANVSERDYKHSKESHDQFETKVSIIDSGSGVDSILLNSNKLFSKFGSNEPSGTGLGLYISKKIIEAHGGKIWAENNAYKKGAAFTFTLPLKISD